jgi:tetratricopeptide (TPR) repeat protein
MDPSSLDQKESGSLSQDELISRGVQCGQSGDYQEALRIFELCLTLDPWNSILINNKADALRGLGRIEDARELVMWALTINPKLSIGWCTLGEIQILAGERFSGRISLELALSLMDCNESYYSVTLQHLNALNDLEGSK